MEMIFMKVLVHVSLEACELSVLVQACTSTGKKIVKILMCHSLLWHLNSYGILWLAIVTDLGGLMMMTLFNLCA
jgi:hypothetical protein